MFAINASPSSTILLKVVVWFNSVYFVVLYGILIKGIFLDLANKYVVACCGISLCTLSICIALSGW